MLWVLRRHAQIQEFLPGGVQALLPENSSDNVFFQSSTFYSSIVISKKTIIFQSFRGGPIFSRGVHHFPGGGGSNFFQGVGGSKC